MKSPTVLGTGTLLWCQCIRADDGSLIRNEDCIADYKEVLYDGPASSSKTYSDLAFIFWLMSTRSGVRILGLRRTLKSFRESVQVLFEDHILGPDHLWLKTGGSRHTRTSYTNTDPHSPGFGAHFAIGGTDDIEKHLSSEWDFVYFFEATEPGMTEYDWNTIGTRMRGVGVPHPHCDYPDGVYDDGRAITDVLDSSERFAERMVGDRKVGAGCDDQGTPLFWRQRRAECNPSIIEGEQHWLMKRWRAGIMIRLFASHADNPRNTSDYLDELRSLPEPFRSVYYEGHWVSVEGKCWPTYSPERHLILGSFRVDPNTGQALVTVTEPSWCIGGRAKVVQIASVIAGFDWGINHPGSLQIMAVAGTGAGRIAFRVAEVHMSNQTLDWWAQRVVEMVDKYRIQAVLCDPSARGFWEHFNRVLGARAGRDQGGICQAADNTRSSVDWVQGGIDLVRTMFAQDRVFLLRDAHEGPVDEALKRNRKPTGLAEEIPGYIMARDKNNPDRVLPYPDKDRGMDDAADSFRYACMDIFEQDRRMRPKAFAAPKTLDDLQEMEDRRAEEAGLAEMLTRRKRRW